MAREATLRLCRELLSVSAAEIAAALDVAPSGLSIDGAAAYTRAEGERYGVCSSGGGVAGAIGAVHEVWGQVDDCRTVLK